jgi:hypothetical protein
MNGSARGAIAGRSLDHLDDDARELLEELISAGFERAGSDSRDDVTAITMANLEAMIEHLEGIEAPLDAAAVRGILAGLCPLWPFC